MKKINQMLKLKKHRLKIFQNQKNDQKIRGPIFFFFGCLSLGTGEGYPSLPHQTQTHRRHPPNSVLFVHPRPISTFSNCLSHSNPARGWPYRFRSGGTAGSSMLDQDSGHVSRGRRIHTSGQSDFEIFHNFGVSLFLLVCVS